ncbi:hypothetical protein FQN57_002668 [Myotisia sp. PD_48]|nr:hypothetical protein FQN57_002668 [Myotisia sp. PD_48]
MTFQNVPLSIGRKRIFDSVFPPTPLSNTIPTPKPTHGVSSSAKLSDEARSSITPRGGAKSRSETEATSMNPPLVPELGNLAEQNHWDQAWHAATNYLAVPDEGFRTGGYRDDDSLDDQLLLRRWDQGEPNPLVRDSLFYVGADVSPGKKKRTGRSECDLLRWYLEEIRRHFVTNFRDFLVKELRHNRQGTIQRLVRYLRIAQNIYFSKFEKSILPLSDPCTRPTTCKILNETIHTVISYSIPAVDFSTSLADEIYPWCAVILGVHSNVPSDEATDYNSLRPKSNAEDEMDVDSKYVLAYDKWKKEPSQSARLAMMTADEPTLVSKSRHSMLQLLDELHNVGLGGEKAQKVFANVMNNMITEFVMSSYTKSWGSPSLANEHLRLWIENIFSRLVVQALDILLPGSSSQMNVPLSDMEKWKDIAISRLAALRINELFDVVVDWDSSSGAIEDLKTYTTNPTTRFYLTSVFSTAIVQRLLQPGASTVEILQLYISIIRALTQLDPRGVLLDRVARPIRRYLRDRDDTVRVIVGGLLADTSQASDAKADTDPEILTDLAKELIRSQQSTLKENTSELDWNDMNWVPDPVDAAPDHKKSKQSDVVGSLISLFESKEIFVKELQKSLSDRLLEKSGHYMQEVALLELLKVRFGDATLQACEVMLRDVMDPNKLDTGIRSDQNFVSDATAHDQLSNHFHAKILSHLYWPPLPEQPFKIPDKITSLQTRYSAGFEARKASRKLTWLNGLGSVVVELDLEDRVFQDQVTTWQATVIYAFQSPPTGMNDVATRTVSDLSHELDMPLPLVRSACLFWLSKRILTQTQPDTFSVLEVLPDDENTMDTSNTQGQRTGKVAADHDAGAVMAAARAAEQAAKESADAATMEKMNLYWQFIVGMLTNQGAMPLQRIVMMLKIAVPGGFPYSNEELKQFLGKMVSDGKLEMAGGGHYKIV